MSNTQSLLETFILREGMILQLKASIRGGRDLGSCYVAQVSFELTMYTCSGWLRTHDPSESALPPMTKQAFNILVCDLRMV